jgi:GTP-binding protein YchF
VVRCFEDENVIHVDTRIDPARDIETIETELILKDLDTVQKRIDAAARRAKANEREAREEVEVAERLRDHLSAGHLAITFQRNENERQLLSEYHLLTDKPVMYIANTDEQGVVEGNAYIEAVRAIAEGRGFKVVPVCAKIEAEIAELPHEERGPFLESLGLREPGLNAIIRTGYDLLGLITFFTAGDKECRAWTVRRGATAPEAAGVIHTDFQKGFIRAEVMSYEDLHRLGSEAAVKEAGLYRIEGKEYVTKDGDVMYYRFNV